MNLRLARFLGLVLVFVLAAGCHHGLGDRGEGGEGPEIDYSNPIDGVEVASVDEANEKVPFEVHVPQGLGDPSAIFVSPADRLDQQVDFLFETPDYGLISVQEYQAEMTPDDWKAFLDSVVASNDGPTVEGSAEAVTLESGGLALITTSEDKSHSTAEWIDAEGRIQYLVTGPKTDPQNILTVANSV